jgi:hypothetical protein
MKMEATRMGYLRQQTANNHARSERGHCKNPSKSFLWCQSSSLGEAARTFRILLESREPKIDNPRCHQTLASCRNVFLESFALVGIRKIKDTVWE